MKSYCTYCDVISCVICMSNKAECFEKEEIKGE